MRHGDLTFAPWRLKNGYACYAEDRRSGTAKTIECGYGSTVVGAFDDVLKKLRTDEKHAEWKEVVG